MRNLFFIIMTLTFTFLGAENWYSYTDNVMGGKSELVAKVNEDNSITLKGDVTTENNGGFVRLATRPDGLSENIKGIRFQAKGNNETYDLHVSLKGIKMPPWSFKSKKFYVSDQWQDFQIEFKDFKNYGYSARRFKPTNFNEVSFAGYGRDFKVNLELRNIEFY
jgi:hypothetical protein